MMKYTEIFFDFRAPISLAFLVGIILFIGMIPHLNTEPKELIEISCYGEPVATDNVLSDGRVTYNCRIIK